MKKSLSWIKQGNCIICTSHSSRSNSYPSMSRGNRRMSVARHIIFKKHGEQPYEVVSRHTCDNRLCINPDHILFGSRADNVQDMISRGRARHPAGISLPFSKLTEEQVLEIYRLACIGEMSQRLIAVKFKTFKSTVSRIKNKKMWQHLTQVLP